MQAVGTVLIFPPVWIAAVTGHFHASRGLAIAVALAGTGVGAALWPNLAAFYIGQLGWRLALVALGATWGAVMLPLTLVFFKDPIGNPRADATSLRARREPASPLIRTPTFLLLAASGGIFICVTYGMTLHLVPILRGKGLSLVGAAAIAGGGAGLASIAGRITTGILLDFVPTRLFSPAIFILPIAVCLLLILGGRSMPPLIAAVILLGMAMGGESDIVTYIVSQRFPQPIFGSVYAVMQTVFSVASIAGSMLAGFLYDLSGNYELFLAAVIPMTIIAATLIAIVPEREIG